MDNDKVVQLKTKQKDFTDKDIEVYEELNAELQKNRDEERVSQLTRGITLSVLNLLNREGFVVGDPLFVDDMTLAMEYIRSAMYRQLGIHHTLHDFIDDEE